MLNDDGTTRTDVATSVPGTSAIGCARLWTLSGINGPDARDIDHASGENGLTAEGLAVPTAQRLERRAPCVGVVGARAPRLELRTGDARPRAHRDFGRAVGRVRNRRHIEQLLDLRDRP